MWYEFVSNKQCLERLYREIPDLCDVRIESLDIDREGTRLTIAFDMPKYVDFPPQKWHPEYNTAFVELSLSGIESLKIKYSRVFLKSSVSVEKVSDGFLCVNIRGGVTAEICVDSVHISKVSGYFKCLDKS